MLGSGKTLAVLVSFEKSENEADATTPLQYVRFSGGWVGRKRPAEQCLGERPRVKDECTAWCSNLSLQCDHKS